MAIVPNESIPNNTNYKAAPIESTETPVVNPVSSTSSSSFQVSCNSLTKHSRLKVKFSFHRLVEILRSCCMT